MSDRIDTDDISDAIARETTSAKDRADLVRRVRDELQAEERRRRGLLEQLRTNWALIASLMAASLGVWQSYDGLRREVAKATESLSSLRTTVERLSTSERTSGDRVLQLELRYEALRDRVKSLEDWAQRAASTPAGRRLEMPPSAAKE